MSKIKHLIIAVFILIGCHATEAGWKDWFSGTSWKQWFSTTRIGKWLYEKPEVTQPIITKAVLTAYQQQAISPATMTKIQETLKKLFDQNLSLLDYVTKDSPAIKKYEQEASLAANTLLNDEFATIPSLPDEVLRTKKSPPVLSFEELSNDLDTAIHRFLANAKPFFSDIRKMVHESDPNFEDFFSKYEAFIKDRDSIQTFLVPQSIAQVLKSFKTDNATLENKKALALTAFSLLYSNLPWSYLTNANTLKQQEFPSQILNKFEEYLRNYHPEIVIDDYKDITRTGTVKIKSSLPDKELNRILTLLRRYKLYLEHNSLLGSRNRFARALQQIDPVFDTNWIIKFGS